MYETYPLIGEYLDGTTASGLHEAKLGYEYMKKRESWFYAAAYRDDEMGGTFIHLRHMLYLIRFRSGIGLRIKR